MVVGFASTLTVFLFFANLCVCERERERERESEKERERERVAQREEEREGWVRYRLHLQPTGVGIPMLRRQRGGKRAEVGGGAKAPKSEVRQSSFSGIVELRSSSDFTHRKSLRLVGEARLSWTAVRPAAGCGSSPLRRIP